MTSDDTLNRFDDFLDRRQATGDNLPRSKRGGRQPTVVDPALDETVRRLHALDAHDREPEPRPQFLSQLQEDLMNQALTMPSGSTEHSSSVFRPSLRSGKALPPLSPIGASSSALPPRRLWPNLAAAAIILLTIGAGILAYRLAPNGSDDTPTLPAAAQGTPDATAAATSAVDIAECATTPRPAGTVAALMGAPPITSPALPSLEDRGAAVDVNALLADLPEADPETATGISWTAFQLTACRFYATPRDLDAPDFRSDPDLDGRYFALYSDDFFRRELFQSEANAAVGLPGIWTPRDPTGLVVETPRRLLDGRVAAVISSPEGHRPTVLIIFTKQGENWLVDEYRPIDGAAAPAVRSQFLEIPLWDDGGSIWDYQNVIGGPFHAHEPVILTIANLGSRPHRFVIEELGIDVEAQPDHSQSFVFNPPPGTYGVASAVIKEGGQLQPVPILPGEMVFVARQSGTPTPPQASPTLDGTAVDIAECELSMQPDLIAADIAGTPTVTTALLPRYAAKEPVDANTILADLPEADADIRTGITNTVRQWTACRFLVTAIDDPSAPEATSGHFPLYSDDYVRRETGADGTAPAYWVPVGPTPMQIIDLRLLPDGRAVALLGWSAPDQGPAEQMVAVFVDDGERWLVDEISQAATAGEMTGTPTATVPDGSAQFLEVAAWDDGALYSAFPPELPFAANEQLVVTLANVGTMPHRLQIAALGIDAEAQPGHSVTFVLIPAEGSYEVISSVVGEDGQSTQATSKTFLFARQGAGTPSPPQG